MNTDKIYAEAIANEYAPKETSKVNAFDNAIANKIEKEKRLHHLLQSTPWCTLEQCKIPCNY